MTDPFTIGQSNTIADLTRALHEQNSETRELRTEIVRLESQRHRPAGIVTTDDSLMAENKKLRAELDGTNRILARMGESKRALEEALKERDELILEWTHATESFKKLAVTYGKSLGKSGDERLDDYAATVLAVAEADPRFSNTELFKRLKNKISN